MPAEDDAPLTARSVLASTLLGADPPELPVAYLVSMASLFGINENRARVALSRMAGSGEAVTDGGGRYRLAGHLVERQQRQATSRAGVTVEWPGGWHVAVVTTAGSSAETRADRRRALARARLAELREGVWLRPDNLALALPDRLAGDVVVLTRCVPAGGDAALAQRLWDLPGWAAAADAFRARLAALPPRTAADLAPGFVLSAAVLRHLVADPLLPAELLPRAWPGARLRRDYDDWDGRYRQALGRFGEMSRPG